MIINYPVKQHIIPKTYLKHFSSGNKQIWLYQKDSSSFREQQIKNVPIINDFYTMIDKENDDQKLYILEKFLGESIEPLYTPYIKKIERGLILTNLEKKEFSFFIAAQKLRTPKMEKTIINEIENSFRNDISGYWIVASDIKKFKLDIFKDGIKANIEDYKVVVDENKENIELNIARDCYLQILPDLILKLAEKISKQKWSYLKIPLKRYVVTSDNPVIFTTETGLNGNIGGYFPLTKQFVLNFDSYEEKVKTINLNEIKRINHLLVNNSERFVFGHNEFFLKNIIKKSK